MYIYIPTFHEPRVSETEVLIRAINDIDNETFEWWDRQLSPCASNVSVAQENFILKSVSNYLSTKLEPVWAARNCFLNLISPSIFISTNNSNYSLNAVYSLFISLFPKSVRGIWNSCVTTEFGM